MENENYRKMPWKDYDGYDYHLYWDSSVRLYEDHVERLALRQLLPSGQKSIVDLGANYGRLADEYRQFREVILVDGALTAIQQAHKIWENDGFQCSVCDIRIVPFPANTFDVVVCIRTLHHQSNVKSVFEEASRIIKKGGIFVFNFANKNNLKHKLLSPLGLSTREIKNINPTMIGTNVYNFHPEHIDAVLSASGFKKERQLGVGIFRHRLFAGLIPSHLLAKADAFLQNKLKTHILSPSVFVLARKV